VDWTLIVLVLVFALRGAFRGAITQVFVLVGMFLGLWAVVLTSRWVGEHWQGARPAVVFWLLRWLVAGLAGFSVAALFQWSGERAGRSVREGPLGGFDRALGVVLGAATGALFALVIVFGVLRLPDVAGLVDPVARARVTAPILEQGRTLCERSKRVVPGGRWFRHQLQLATDRAAARAAALPRTRRS